MGRQSWTVEELREEIERYERELRSAGMQPATIQTYTDRARRFVSWLSGDYKPGRTDALKGGRQSDEDNGVLE